MKRILFTFLLLNSISAYSQVNLNLGLRAYYPFNGNANDASGNNNNPVFNNATLTADRLGNPNSAYHFNGTDNYIRIPNSSSINTTNQISLCAWVKPMGFYTGTCHGNSIMMKGDADYLAGNYLLRYDDNFYTNGANCSTPVVDVDHQNFYGANVNAAAPGYTPYIQANQWYSVIYTYDGTTAKLYVNCELKISKAVSGLTFTNSYDLFLGKLNAAAFPYWVNGDLDEIRIYDRAINQDEINVLGGCVTTTTCDNWLHTQVAGQSVKVGDLDISGNQITVEAQFNRTAPYVGTYIYGGDIVSKHTDPGDANYLLRSNDAEITTSNGFFQTPQICEIELNKIYHVAMVYNGSTLKFYRNGFLMSQVAATGNLFQNNVITTIGDWANYVTGVGTNFVGYINEVRIWNVARTQAQIQTYMNSSLPNPSTQTGLQAYYTFDDLLNKQGNAAWNGTLSGAATINTTNTNCNFIADSCKIASNVSNIINDYTPVTGFDACGNKIVVEDASAFNVGDTVVIMQMKGAVIDSTNTASFGNISDYKNAGNYEFNYVKNKTGNIIELTNTLTRQYDVPTGKVQLIRVPYYSSANVSGTLTCLPWDGKKGGVLVLNARDSVILNADIDVTGKGFRGGNTYVFGPAVLSCFVDNYFLDSSSTSSSRKGEGIADISAARLNGRGHLANGGGGGNGHNSGGGGGGNAAVGGLGGYQLYECNSSFYDNRGLGGIALNYNNAANKIYLGGGGGAGHKDGIPNPAVPLSSAGGDGGGIVIIITNYLKSNNHAIIADGAHGKQCDIDGFTCLHDGMGGGGGGGTILMNVTNYVDAHKENVKGGKGADLILFNAAAGHVAPGGGGAGGIVWFNAAALPVNATVTNTGGNNGVIPLDSNNPHGSTAGQPGSNLFNLVLPIDNVLFKPNIDSVRFKDSSTACLSFDFKGFGYTNTNPVVSWNWAFGDGGTANTQNTSHTYTSAGTYTVKLVVTDINGCKDSLSRDVTANACVTNSISGIINDYTPVLALSPCDNKITVEDASAFNVGDTVLMIQMKGAVIDSTNSNTFGTIIDYKNAGNYEYNYVKSKAGNIIELLNRLTRQYDIPAGKVQLIRVPYYNTTNVSAMLTCLPWDGSKGGVLVFNVRDTLSLNANIDVSAKGFRGGANGNNLTNTWNCFAANFSYPLGNSLGAAKGEGIAILSNNHLSGKGAYANGGGGGQDHNSGGGGGGNSGLGGRGGYQYEQCAGTVPFDNGGLNGKSLTYSNAANRVFMGGGGGSGHANNTAGFNPDGGNGGGIIIIKTNVFIGNNLNIISNGDNAITCTPNAPNNNCNEGMGGGGAAGTILLDVNTYSNNITVKTNGGKGADVNFYWSPSPSDPNKHGPGGGGAGGMIWLKQPTLPAGVTTNNSAGANGLNIGYGNDPWGSTAGQAGNNLFNLVLPPDGVLFKPNIDSVRFKDSSTACLSFDFKGFGYTNTNPVASWNWFFGDGGTANTQNTSHSYANAGTYTVKLVVTDINGCKDSLSRDVVSNTLTVDAGSDSAFCGGPATLQLHGNVGGTGTVSWTPGAPLDNSTILTPTATVNTTTTFYLTVTGAGTCTGKDSVTVTINSVPVVHTLQDTAVCKGTSLILATTPGLSTYHWSPGTSLNDSTIANPNFTDTVSTTLIITGSDGTCSASDTINVTVKPLPIVNAGRDTSICGSQTLTLSGSGAVTYSWSPATSLSDPGSPNPVFTGNNTTTYYLTGTGANGCEGKDSVTITVNTSASLIQPPNKSFCEQESVVLDGANGNAVQYLWSPSTYLSNTNSINPVANPPASTSYSVTITDPVCNFNSTFTVNVTVWQLPAISATRSNDIDCALRTSRLTATGALQYLWTPASSLNNPGVSNPIASPGSNTEYFVTGTDINGCSNTASVMVLVKGGIGGYDIPNSFTPNGDGLNDCFGIKHWGNSAQNVIFMIYSRWGEKIFETTDVNKCWDGTYKGLPADAGTYVFYASGDTPCGHIVKKGNVVLIR